MSPTGSPSPSRRLSHASSVASSGLQEQGYPFVSSSTRPDFFPAPSLGPAVSAADFQSAVERNGVSWMSLVISAGTFLKRKDAVHPFGASGVPSLGNSLFAPLRSPLTAGESWVGTCALRTAENEAGRRGARSLSVPQRPPAVKKCSPSLPRSGSDTETFSG